MKVSIQHSRPKKDYILFLLIHPAMGEAILRTRVTPKCCKLKELHLLQRGMGHLHDRSRREKPRVDSATVSRFVWRLSRYTVLGL